MRAHIFRALAVVVAAFLLVTNPVVAEAGRTITGKQIKNNTVTSADIKNKSLLAKDFKPGQLPSGTVGPVGPEGPAGPVGPEGPAGPVGPEGPEGEQGPDGAQGPEGEQGPEGADGQPGPAGPMGPSGIVHDEALDGAGNRTRVPTSGLASGTITAGDVDEFTIISFGGAAVRITMLGTSPGCLADEDTYLEILDPSGAVILANDDVDGTLCSSLVFTPANNVVYRIRARGLNSAAEFDYVLKLDRAF